MSYALGVIIFLVAFLVVSVMLHEAGHFLTAKHYGMKATKFFVGFGPTLWSFRRGETEYGVKAIPAGGFVKIIGMTPLEEVDPGDENRAFWRQPARQRFVVLVAGSLMHFLIAIFMVFGILATTGDAIQSQSTLTVDSTYKCVPVNANAASCAKGDPVAPALGKLHHGDRIVAVNGQSVSSFTAVQHAIQNSVGTPLRLTLLRSGQRVQVTVTPIATHDGKKALGRIGFTPEIENKPLSVAASVPRTFSTLGDFFTSTVRALGQIPSEVSGILQGKPRSATGAASVVDVARVSGQIASAKDQSVGARVAALMLIIAQLNFFVGVFNLLPLLPLDGGHIGILLFERARAGLYRLIGRRDPGRVDLMKILPVTYAVVAVFIGLSLILLYAGIFNPIRLQ